MRRAGRRRRGCAARTHVADELLARSERLQLAHHVVELAAPDVREHARGVAAPPIVFVVVHVKHGSEREPRPAARRGREEARLARHATHVRLRRRAWCGKRTLLESSASACVGLLRATAVKRNS